MARDPISTLRRPGPPTNLDAIFAALSPAIVCLDAAGTVTAWSQGAQDLYGHTPEQARGRSFAELVVPPEARADDERSRLAALAGAESATAETPRVRADGTRLDVTSTLSAFLVGGIVVGLCRSEQEGVRDPGRDPQGVEEIKRLRERNRRHVEFLNEVSHELNTPLTPIRLQVQLLKMRQDLSPGEVANLDAIERNVLRMGLLVQDMLDTARLQAGRFRLDRSSLDLCDLVQEAAVSFHEQAHKEGIELEAHCTRGLLASMDGTRVMQVLFNLLSNALKFTPRGGRVEIGSARQDGDALIWVRDSGIGLSQEQNSQLFHPFVRLHEARKSTAKGTGLGLFISKGIIEQHGGRIWVESAGPDQGSTWWFTLPLAPAASRPSLQEEAYDTPGPNGAPA